MRMTGVTIALMTQYFLQLEAMVSFLVVLEEMWVDAKWLVRDKSQHYLRLVNDVSQNPPLTSSAGDRLSAPHHLSAEHLGTICVPAGNFYMQ